MSLYRRLTNAIKREPFSRELDREFAFHLAERVDELRAAGLNEKEALEKARRQFGNLTLQKERSRDMHVSMWLEAMLRNVRLAFRALKRTPALSAGVIVTLALGIGANSAVFSVIDDVLLRPLSFPKADQLMWITHAQPRTPAIPVAPVRVEDWNRMNSTFQAIAGYYPEDTSEISGEVPERLRRALVSRRFLQVWGVAPALGRGFSPDEEKPGGPAVVLISDRLWRRRFGADFSVIGKRLLFARASAAIVGVMPASFLFPDRDVDLWSPTPGTPVRQATWFSVIGRLKPGLSVDQARADLSTVQAQLGAQFPATDAKLTVHVQPLKQETVGDVGRSLWIVFGSVSVLLLIACANIAALLLSRAIQKRPELTIRLSLGASRLSLVSQMLTETAVLAMCGGGIGILLAAEAPAIFRKLAGNLPRMQEVRLDWRIAAYTLICTLAVTFLCGVIPALRTTGRHLPVARGEVSGRHRLQWLLVGTQVALAVTLLAGAGLLVRSLQALGRVAPGFDPSHVLTFQMSASWAETTDYPALFRRIDRTLEFLNTIPGVQASATTDSLPGVPVLRQRSELNLSGTKVIAESRFVSRAYFGVTRIPMIAGEGCPASGGPPAQSADVLVNRSFANRYLAAVGHPVSGLANFPPGEIRGIVGDAREGGLSAEPVPTVYWCDSASAPAPFFLVRTSGEPSAMVETIRRKLGEIEPMRSVFNVAPLIDKLDDAASENRLRTLLLSVFAATAILLACVGLYSTLSYLVVIKRREIGLRVALGAERGSIVQHFFGKGLGVTGVACLVGLGMALGLTRFLAGMLYGVSASDPITLSAVVVLVFLVGSMASLVPAIRAARVDPMKVLRDE
jgi:putative ABC transport system permease protein